MNDMISTGVAAKSLGVSRQYVLGLVRKGILKALTPGLGAHARISVAELRRFAADNDMLLTGELADQPAEHVANNMEEQE
jgi:excisionase family DNA binding protein